MKDWNETPLLKTQEKFKKMSLFFNLNLKQASIAIVQSSHQYSFKLIIKTLRAL